LSSRLREEFESRDENMISAGKNNLRRIPESLWIVIDGASVETQTIQEKRACPS